MSPKGAIQRSGALVALSVTGFFVSGFAGGSSFAETHGLPGAIKIGGVKTGGFTLKEATTAVQTAFARPVPVIIAGTRTELDRAPFVGQGPGAIVSSAWTWNLSGVNTSDLTISFKADGPSLSFDSATLDVKTAPEPGTWALLILGLAAGGLALRRSR